MKKWGIIDVLLVLVFIFAITNFFTWITAGLFESLVKVQKYFIATLFQTSAVLLAFMYFKIIKGLSWKKFGFNFNSPYKIIKNGISGGILLFFIVVVTGIVMQLFFPQEPSLQPFAELVIEAKEYSDLVALFIMGSFLAPLGEEIYFRGMVYPAFKNKWGMLGGLMASGLFFSLLHFDIVRFVPLMLGGIGLAFIYEKSGSLFACMIAHGLWNGIMILLLFKTGTIL